jgi:hypothetical protein
VTVRTLWNTWKSGFFSSSAAQQGGEEDGKTETPSSTNDDGTGAATGVSTDEETGQKYTTEELQAALNECVENLEAEKKKVSAIKRE